MHEFPLAGLALALTLAAPLAALAESPEDLSALRREVDALRAAYEQRLQVLEQRLQKAEAATAAAPATAPAPAPVASVPAVSVPSAAPSASANAFNPALSLILSGIYARTSRDPANYAITGFALPPGAEIGPGTRGFSLAESELGFAASIDPWFRGEARVALLPDHSLSVEEAFVQTTALGNGLALKAGRFYSGIGYLNPRHAHTWDFVDNPLAYQALLGTQYGDDGVQLTWLAPLGRYLEFGAELGRGRGFPGSDSSRNGAGMSSLFAHTGGDIGFSQNWRAGLSMLNTKANDQPLIASGRGMSPLSAAFNGSTRVLIADAVWKWAPDGNPTRTNLTLQGEYLHSTRRGDLTYDADGGGGTHGWRSVQSGWYLQGVYQFLPRWRVGVRTERLRPATLDDEGADRGAFAGSGYRPSKNTLMLDFNLSEFSRVRVQFARDRSRDGFADNQFFVQYQMSLGAHRTHRY